MSEQTKIQWADSTLNFWSGCTKVSPGCANCYAEALSDRFHAGQPNPIFGKWGKGAPRQRHAAAFKTALKLNRKPWVCDTCGEAHASKPVQCKTSFCTGFHRRRIFSLSLGDWLDDEVPIEWLAEMLDTIRQCDQVTWILCTKRPEKWLERVEAVMAWELQQYRPNGNTTGSAIIDEYHPLYWWLKKWVGGTILDRPPKNVILLTSVEDQPQADRRIPELLRIPAACRGLSLEPLLGPVGLQSFTNGYGAPIAQLDWLIIGGESGPSARPCNVEWIRSLVRQGQAAGVATFVKQLGANPIGVTEPFGEDREQSEVVLRDKKGADPAEWPADLRIQQWPEVGA